VTDVEVNTLGVIIAGISVVSSGMQQILCGTIQRKHKMSSHQLLSNTAPVQVRRRPPGHTPQRGGPGRARPLPYLTAAALAAAAARLQGIMLLFIGPFMDQAISHKWILDYEYNVPAMGYLFFSCAIAVLVNISQFMCLGRFTAVTFQVRRACMLRGASCVRGSGAA
jgi:solute carrier family 35 protein E3